MTEPLEPLSSGDTILDERTSTTSGDGDHERFSHYVPKDRIVESAVTGEPIVALCGKVWVPSRDPSRFPICPDCDKIFRGLPPGRDK